MMDPRIAGIDAPGHLSVEMRPGEPWRRTHEFFEDDKVTVMPLTGVESASVIVLDPRTSTAIATAETTVIRDGNGDAVAVDVEFSSESTAAIRNALRCAPNRTTTQPQTPFGRYQFRLTDDNGDSFSVIDGVVALREVAR